jgi:radical SAM superfamily enzyme YgiQ (UPF0313 family)
MINGTRTVGDIISSMVTEFPDVASDMVTADVHSFIHVLEDRHLLYLPRRATADVLLVVPPLSRYYAPDAASVAENSAPPLGLLYIAAVLRDAGIKVAVRDMAAERLSVFDVARLLAEIRPRIVGVSVLTNVLPESQEILRQIKALEPAVATVVGGVHPSALPGEMLLDSNIDYVVRGEGEYAMLNLCSAILSEARPEDLPGLCYRRGGGTHLSPEDAAVSALEILPPPARELVNLELYLQKGAVLASRGCPYACYFCSTVELTMHRYRPRKPESVVEELLALERTYRLRDFEFQDDNFTASPASCRFLCQLLAPHQYHWGCQGTIRQLVQDLSLLEEMAAAGCKHIFFGLESGNDTLLGKLKGVSVADVKTVIEEAIHLGVHIAAGFIVGHPEDTAATIADSLQLALWLRERHVHTPVGVLNCFPGSALHREPKRFGITVLNKNYSDYIFPRVNIQTQHLPATALRDAYVGFVSALANTYGE